MELRPKYDGIAYRKKLKRALFYIIAKSTKNCCRTLLRSASVQCLKCQEKTILSVNFSLRHKDKSNI